MVTAKKHPLWRCPECGRRFANKNQWHSCLKMTEAEHLRDKTPHAKALYRAFKAAAKEAGPMRVHAAKTRIGFITRMTFANASLKKRWIDVAFGLTYRSKSPRFHKIESFGPSLYHHQLRIHALAEINDELRGWLREAYEVGQQEHIGHGEFEEEI